MPPPYGRHSQSSEKEAAAKAKAIGVLCAAVALATAMPAAAQDGETVTPYFNQAIPNIPGKSLVAQFVDYTPGGASASHAHAKSAFVFAYVLSGEIESQVNEEPKRVYRASESWYETHHYRAAPGRLTQPWGSFLRHFAGAAGILKLLLP